MIISAVSCQIILKSELVEFNKCDYNQGIWSQVLTGQNKIRSSLYQNNLNPQRGKRGRVGSSWVETVRIFKVDNLDNLDANKLNKACTNILTGSFPYFHHHPKQFRDYGHIAICIVCMSVIVAFPVRRRETNEFSNAGYDSLLSSRALSSWPMELNPHSWHQQVFTVPPGG